MKPRDKAHDSEPAISVRAKDGVLVEMILRPESGEARLVTFRNGTVEEHQSISLDGHENVPYSAGNNLLTHRVIVLPSGGVFDHTVAVHVDPAEMRMGGLVLRQRDCPLRHGRATGHLGLTEFEPAWQVDA